MGLAQLAGEISEVFATHQRQLIETHANQRVSFNFDAVKELPGVDCFVERSGAHDEVVHLRFPLFGPNSLSSEAPLGALGKMVVCIEMLPTGSTSADVSLLGEQLGLSSSYIPPRWSLDMSLWDYLPPIQERLRMGWMKRKEMCTEALVASSSVLEFETMDFSWACVLAKSPNVKQAKGNARLIKFHFSLDFPETPPRMTIVEFQGAGEWKLDPVLYRYSPRWTTLRMAQELLMHALSANQQAWEN